MSHAAERVELEINENGWGPKFIIKPTGSRIRVSWTNWFGVEVEKSSVINGGTWEPLRKSRFSDTTSLGESDLFYRFSKSPDFPRRPGFLWIPEGYSPDTPHTLIVNLHFYSPNEASPVEGGADSMLEREIPMLHLVDKKGFLYLNPVGTYNPSLTTQAAWVWNASDQCCVGTAQQPFIDDVSYISTLVEKVIERYNVDTARIFIMGGSNGGTMAHTMLCERSDIFAAGVNISGAGWTDSDRCMPNSTNISVLKIHGTTDFYDGGKALIVPSTPVMEILGNWAERLGYEKDDFEVEPNAIDIDRGVDGKETDRLVWGRKLEHWKVNRGGYNIRATEEFSEAVYSWLMDHPKMR